MSNQSQKKSKVAKGGLKRKCPDSSQREDHFNSVFRATLRTTADYSGIRADLEEHGVAVVKNVLGETKREAFLSAFWAALKKRKPTIDKEDHTTWTAENVEWYGNFGAGQYKHYGMAQEEHCWIVRQDQTIRDIFEKGVFGDSKDNTPRDCCVSLDGAAAVFSPSESKLKLHVDVVPNCAGFDIGSVQGSYNAMEVLVDEKAGKYGAGFVCVPGSHHGYNQRWATRTANSGFKYPKKHWFELEVESPLHGQEQLVPCPADSLILWKSELLHRNYGGDFTTSELHNQPCRMTQFVAWQPRDMRTHAVLQKKVKVVLEGKCLNHWASVPTTMVPIKPFPAWSEKSNAIPVMLPITELSPAHRNLL